MRLHGVTIQKSILYIFIALKTSRILTARRLYAVGTTQHARLGGVMLLMDSINVSPKHQNVVINETAGNFERVH
jgi:hypothetical protein